MKTNTLCNQESAPEAHLAEKVATRKPHYRVRESEKDYSLSVEMPGVRRQDVRLTLKDNVLEIEGHRHTPVPREWRVLSRETETSDYRLVLTLHVEIQEDNIAANVEDGLLTVTLPKPEKSCPRSISIE